MSLFHKLSVSHKLLFGFSTLLLLLFVVGFVGFWNARSIQGNLIQIFDIQMPAIDYLIEADRDFQQLLVAERSLLTVDLGSKQYKMFLEDYQENMEQSWTRWNKYKELASSEKEKEHIDLFEKAYQQWAVSTEKVLSWIQSPSPSGHDSAEAQSIGPASRYFEEMRDQIDQLTELNLAYAQDAKNSSESSYQISMVILILVMLGAIFFGLMMWIIVNRNVTVPIKQVMERIKDIAKGEGDLTQRIQVNSQDEVGQLAEWFNKFVEQLQLLIKDLVETSVNLEGLSQTLVTLANGVAQTSDEASQHTKTSMVSVEELNSSMNHIALAMNQANTTSNMVATAAEEMAVTILDIAKNAENARDVSVGAVTQTTKSSEQIQALGDAVHGISRFVKTIDDISSQVNLLALNATIEAASAGEAGKGFAVVANEIKDLARQTSAATQEIAAQIEEMQAKSVQTLESVDSFRSVINDVNSVVTTIAAAVEEQSITTNEISTNILQTSQGIQGISQNVKENSETTSSVVSDVNELSLSVQALAEKGQSINASAEQLIDMAKNLNMKVSRFRI